MDTIQRTQEGILLRTWVPVSEVGANGRVCSIVERGLLGEVLQDKSISRTRNLCRRRSILMLVVSSWWNKLRSPLLPSVFKLENEGVAHCVGFGGAGNAGWRYHDEQVDDFAT